MEIEVYKAQGYDNKQVQDLKIEATNEILPSFGNIDLSYQYFRADAEKIFNGFCSSLPGGTVDQLLLLLLEHKANQFTVPYIKFKEKENNG